MRTTIFIFLAAFTLCMAEGDYINSFFFIIRES